MCSVLPDYITKTGDIDLEESCVYQCKHYEIFFSHDELILKYKNDKIQSLLWISPQFELKLGNKSCFYKVKQVWWSDSLRTMFVIMTCYQKCPNIQKISFSIACFTKGKYEGRNVRLHMT